MRENNNELAPIPPKGVAAVEYIGLKLRELFTPVCFAPLRGVGGPRLLIALFLILTLSACHQNPKNLSNTIVCTTGMIGDAVKNLLGDSADVKALMGAGVDPHLYKATQGDIAALSEAKVIVYNGLHLEGKMGEIFEKLENRKTILAMADGLDESKLINSTDYVGAEDPHIWFDVALWAEVIENLSQELQKSFPEKEKQIAENAELYLQKMQRLDAYCEATIAEIPENQRVLITAHDAFKYFGKAYGIEVRGLQGISTTAEYGLQDISNLVDFIVKNEIKAIFVESSVPKKSVEAVIEGCQRRGHDLQLGGELFSDAMGAAGTPEGTYIGMVRHNVETIVNALK